MGEEEMVRVAEAVEATSAALATSEGPRKTPYIDALGHLVATEASGRLGRIAIVSPALIAGVIGLVVVAPVLMASVGGQSPSVWIGWLATMVVYVVGCAVWRARTESWLSSVTMGRGEAGYRWALASDGDGIEVALHEVSRHETRRRLLPDFERVDVREVVRTRVPSEAEARAYLDAVDGILPDDAPRARVIPPSDRLEVLRADYARAGRSGGRPLGEGASCAPELVP